MTSLLFWSATAVCIIAQAMVVRSLLLGRTPGAVQTPAGRIREVAWVLIPAIALALTLVASWRAVERAPNAEVRTARSVAHGVTR